jgi:hypothetical protein
MPRSLGFDLLSTKMSSHDWPEHKPLDADPSPLEPRSNSVDPPNNSPEVAAFCENILLEIAEDAQSLSKFTSQLAPMGADHPLRATKVYISRSHLLVEAWYN